MLIPQCSKHVKKILLSIGTFILQYFFAFIFSAVIIFGLNQEYHWFDEYSHTDDALILTALMALSILIYILIHLIYARIKLKNLKTQEGRNKILSIENKLNTKGTLNIKELNSFVHTIQEEYSFNAEKMSGYLQEAINNTITNAAEDNVISEELENKIRQFCSCCNFTQKDASNILQKLNKNLLLRCLQKGKLPQIHIEGTLPFNLLKDEKIVWCEQNTGYQQVKDKVEYRGGSTGYSYRVAKGFYIRQGAYRGKPIHIKALEREDEGIFLVTNQHIYFGGTFNKFRISYPKILSYEPHKEGIMIQKESASSLPMLFEVQDSEFICTLIRQIIQLGGELQCTKIRQKNNYSKDATGIQKCSAIRSEDTFPIEPSEEGGIEDNKRTTVENEEKNKKQKKKLHIGRYLSKKVILIGGVILLSIGCVLGGRIYFTKKLSQIMIIWKDTTHYTKVEDINGIISLKRGELLSNIEIKKLSNDIKKLPWIRNAKIERHWRKGEVLISITEKTPVAVWQNNKEYRVLDELGQVIQTNQLPTDLLLVVGADAPQHLLQLLHDLGKVPDIKQHVHAAVRIGEKRWNLKLFDAEKGVDVLLPETNTLNALERLDAHNKKEKLLQRQIAAIDLRTPDKIIVKHLEKNDMSLKTK